MRTLLNKHALITGGGSGIGLAIARRLYAEGCSVTLLGRTEATLRQAQSLIVSSDHEENDGVKRVSYHPLDVSSPSSWQDLLKRCGTVHVLVNCAGITQRSALMKTPVDEVDELVGTNLTGTVLGCKYVGRAMLLKSRSRALLPRTTTEEEGVTAEGVKEKGVIVNVASLLAQKGVVGTSVYAAAKAGVVGLTTSLANEYGRSGIRVNAVLPGYIETDMTSGLKNPSILQQIPLGRFGTTDEVADAALFLIKNPYANNCVLNLDGGLSAV
ncbi:hypothetical protein QBC32DRAFT_267820 [Pseudoneurospora amorphoporcata]|uniref:Ketoreductase domain-containing protein n=1 Tax=Pseudoneurospora amorphoporcata TaxID=241081 RepID=A0AAN6NN51_9PEZI|nr:hypothetical protein QBC32DRAFT_267820 [Pseudoneurospora amorphoporcata]